MLTSVRMTAVNTLQEHTTLVGMTAVESDNLSIVAVVEVAMADWNHSSNRVLVAEILVALGAVVEVGMTD